MLAIEHKAPAAGAVGDRAATWVIYDGKRVAKFQYVGAEGPAGTTPSYLSARAVRNRGPST